MVDLAVGVVVGAAFGNVVSALVKDILTPFIAAIARVPDFSGLAFTINGSSFLYGDFINTTLSFFLVAGSVYFFVVTPFNTFLAKMKKEEPLDPTTKICPHCVSEIPKSATRCKFCTQQV